MSPRLRSVLGAGASFWVPLMAQGRAVGLFYADRQSSERPLTETDFQAFNLFAQQAGMGVGLMAGRGKRT